jgi:chromate transporter
MLPFWDRFRTRLTAQYAMRGANAAVVGVLGSALYDPVWTNAVHDARDFIVVLTGFLLLTVWKVAPWGVVTLLATAGILLKVLWFF